jgi:hypothetical protein
MKLLEHPLWPAIRPYVRVETYDRDGGHAHPRHRIELDDVGRLRPVLLAIEVECAAQCGRLIHPIRARWGGRGGLFVSVSCTLDVNVGCARGPRAHAEYERIIEACGTRPFPPLFA